MATLVMATFQPLNAFAYVSENVTSPAVATGVLGKFNGRTVLAKLLASVNGHSVGAHFVLRRMQDEVLLAFRSLEIC